MLGWWEITSAYYVIHKISEETRLYNYTLVYSPPVPTWPFSYRYVTLDEYKAPLIFIKNYNYNQNTSRNC